MQLRIGQGFDSHRLVPNRPLVLGGVTVPFELGLDGHSDADVLLHALVDAICGAAGLGDIGRLFPNTDPQWKDTSSRVFVEHVAKLLNKQGWNLVNVDSTIFAERPKLAAHIPAMQRACASMLGIGEAQCSVKAKSGEGIGFIGRGEGIAAMVVVLLSQGQLL